MTSEPKIFKVCECCPQAVFPSHKASKVHTCLEKWSKKPSNTWHQSSKQGIYVNLFGFCWREFCLDSKYAGLLSFVPFPKPIASLQREERLTQTCRESQRRESADPMLEWRCPDLRILGFVKAARLSLRETGTAGMRGITLAKSKEKPALGQSWPSCCSHLENELAGQSLSLILSLCVSLYFPNKQNRF